MMKKLAISPSLCVMIVIFLGLSHASFSSTRSLQPVTKSPLSSAKNNQQEDLWSELTGKDLKLLDDVALYSEVLANYQTQNSKGLQMYLETLLKKFPTSPFVENGLYLSGQLALEKQNYPEALKAFQKITQLFGRGSRVVSAQFAKGLTYKKMNLSEQARLVFVEVMKRYPGSPESFRAEAELKLIK